MKPRIDSMKYNSISTRKGFGCLEFLVEIEADVRPWGDQLDSCVQPTDHLQP